MSKTTIKDVAKLANCSISTVSAALNGNLQKVSEAKRNEILRIVEEIEFVKNVNAVGLASRKSKRIGFFLSHAPSFDNSINAKLIYFINSEATKYDIELINIFVDECEKHDEYLLDKIKVHNLTDIILFGLPKDDNNLQKINHLDINKIFIDLPIVGGNSFFISIDNYCAQEALTNKIIDEGKKNLLYISGDMNSYVAIERQRGFLAAANKANIHYEVVKGDFLNATNYELVKKMDVSKFDAIVCSCDAAAMGVIRHLKEISDYSKIVGGFDGITTVEYLNYSIYTVNQRIDLLAEAALEMIVNGKYENRIIDFTIEKYGNKIASIYETN